MIPGYIGCVFYNFIILEAVTFSHLSGNFLIPYQKNWSGLVAKHVSSKFWLPCSYVNRIPVRAICIDGTKGCQKDQDLGYKAPATFLQIVLK